MSWVVTWQVGCRKGESVRMRIHDRQSVRIYGPPFASAPANQNDDDDNNNDSYNDDNIDKKSNDNSTRTALPSSFTSGQAPYLACLCETRKEEEKEGKGWRARDLSRRS
jgi:hypothetical protein